MNSVSTTVVMPAYNEEKRIAGAIRNVRPYVDEVIVIDDASCDRTAEVAEKAGARVLRQKKNAGYIEAVKRGFREAGGKIVVTFDADDEFPAHVIPGLTAPVARGEADMVQGHRDWVPRPSERLLTWLAARRAEVGDSGTGLRALRTDLAKSLELRGACICGIFSLEVIANKGRIKEIPISLNRIDKPRKVAWFHLKQFFYLLPWLLRRYSGA